GLLRARAILRFAVAGEGDQDLPAEVLAAQTLGDHVAVHVRQADVEQDDAWLELPGQAQGGGPVVRELHLVAPAPDQLAERLRGVEAVLDDQDAVAVVGGARRIAHGREYISPAPLSRDGERPPARARRRRGSSPRGAPRCTRDRRARGRVRRGGPTPRGRRGRRAPPPPGPPRSAP